MRRRSEPASNGANRGGDRHDTHQIRQQEFRKEADSTKTVVQAGDTQQLGKGHRKPIRNAADKPLAGIDEERAQGSEDIGEDTKNQVTRRPSEPRSDFDRYRIESAFSIAEFSYF